MGENMNGVGLVINPVTGNIERNELKAAKDYTDSVIEQSGGVTTASQLTFDNTTNGFTADDTQAAIEELNSNKEPVKSADDYYVTNAEKSAIGTIGDKQAALSGTGFIKITGSTISYDNSTYITASSTDTLTNKTFIRYLETIVEPSISAGTLTIDCSINNNFWVAHSSNITTLIFSNVPTAGTQYTANLVLTQDATGTRTFPITATTSTYKVMGATIALNTAANAINTVSFVTKDGGTTWLVYFNKVS